MKKLKIICDQCGNDITETDLMPRWRLELRAVPMPHSDGQRYATQIEPPINEEMHFCTLRCLAGFAHMD